MEETIYKNEQKIESRINEAGRVLPVIAELGKRLKLEGIDLNTETFQGFLDNGTEYLKNILLKGARKDVEKMNISSEKLKRSFINEAMNIDEAEFNRLYSRLHETFGRFHVEMDDISFNKSGAILSKEFKDRIHQQFTVTLVSDEDKEFWAEIQNFCKSFNRLEELAEKTGKDSLKEHMDHHYFDWFTIENHGNYVRIHPDANGFLPYYD